MDDLSKLEFKQGDSLKRAVKAQTTDKLHSVRAPTESSSRWMLPLLPGGRGHGEPVRLIARSPGEPGLRRMLRAPAGRKLPRLPVRGLRLRCAGG